MSNYGNLPLISLLTIVGIFSTCVCVLSSKSEFTYRKRFDYTEDEAQTIKETLFSTLVVNEIMCAAVCSRTVNCIAFLFNIKSKQCLMLYALQMVGSSEISEERYWSYFEMFVGCPAGWEEYAMNCYGFFKDKKDWNTAKMYCESVDARLVAIDNEEENNWIFDRMKYHKDEVNDWWTEGSDEGSEGTWYWHHSNSRMIYTDWNLYLGEPNGKQRENCLLLRLELKWIDCPCSYESKFICEK